MPDDHHAPARPIPQHVVQQVPCSRRHLRIALAIREWLGNMSDPLSVDLVARPPGPCSIVTLPKPGVSKQRQAALAKGDFRRPVGTLEVRAEDGGQVLVGVPTPKLHGLSAATRGEFRVMPSRGDSLLIVNGSGVRFEKENGSSDKRGSW